MKYELKTRYFTLFREQPGVISEPSKPCWVLFYGCYAHMNESLIGLFVEVAKEFKHDKHLVG